VKALAWLSLIGAIGVGALFAVLALGAETFDERLTYWILAGTFAFSGFVVAGIFAAIAASIGRATRLVSVSAEGGGMEQALRTALTAKGVTGALQDEAVRKALDAAAAGETVIDLRDRTDGPPDARPAEQPDPVDQLERLAKLRDQGAISEGEFIAAKSRLLSDL
jgi:hypothetical protein